MKKILSVFLFFTLALFTLDALEIGKISNVNIDGDPAEWANIPAIRFSAMQDSSTPLQWKGVDDLSATVRLAWNQDTLYIQGMVWDESVKKEDCIEIGLAAEPKRWILHGRTLRFQTEKTVVDEASGKLSPMSFKVKNIPANMASEYTFQSVVKELTGAYMFELALPLKMIPDFISPQKSQIYFQMRVTDGDTTRVYSQRLDKLKKMTPFKLVETENVEIAEADAGFYTSLDFPDPVLTKDVSYRLEFADNMLNKNSTVNVKLQKAEQNFKTEDFKKEDGYFMLESKMDLKKVPEGVYDLCITVKPDKQSEKTYVFNKKINVLHKTAVELLPDTIEHLEKVNLPELAQKKPFTASSYFSVVSTVEWLKWGIMQKSVHAVKEAGMEIQARLDAIEGRKLPEKGIYSLLNLSQNP